MNPSRKLGGRFRLFLLSTLFVVGVIFPLSSQAATTADVIFIVDESGSMAGEHAWLGSMISTLDINLNAAGVEGNQYALLGFGATNFHSGVGSDPHKHSVGGGDFGTAASFSTATGGLVAAGGTEDGYEAIAFALSNYTTRPGAVLNIILITDEDRDNTSPDSFASVQTLLNDKNALLNVVVNNPFSVGGNPALGLGGGDAYQADGAGGFTKTPGGSVGNGAGATETQYVPLALNNGGGAWNLNFLRAGGLDADSFTAAFVDLKVTEIVDQNPSNPVPEPGTIILMGTGILGLFAASNWNKKKQAV